MTSQRNRGLNGLENKSKKY